jgi:hypothetical protein
MTVEVPKDILECPCGGGQKQKVASTIYCSDSRAKGLALARDLVLDSGKWKYKQRSTGNVYHTK